MPLSLRPAGRLALSFLLALSSGPVPAARAVPGPDDAKIEAFWNQFTLLEKQIIEYHRSHELSETEFDAYLAEIKPVMDAWKAGNDAPAKAYVATWRTKLMAIAHDYVHNPSSTRIKPRKAGSEHVFEWFSDFERGMINNYLWKVDFTKLGKAPDGVEGQALLDFYKGGIRAKFEAQLDVAQKDLIKKDKEAAQAFVDRWRDLLKTLIDDYAKNGPGPLTDPNAQLAGAEQKLGGTLNQGEAATDPFGKATAALFPGQKVPAGVVEALYVFDEPKRTAIIAAAAKPATDPERVALVAQLTGAVDEKLKTHLVTPDQDLARVLRARGADDEAVLAYFCPRLAAAGTGGSSTPARDQLNELAKQSGQALTAGSAEGMAALASVEPAVVDSCSAYFGRKKTASVVGAPTSDFKPNLTSTLEQTNVPPPGDIKEDKEKGGKEAGKGDGKAGAIATAAGIGAVAGAIVGLGLLPIFGPLALLFGALIGAAVVGGARAAAG